MNLRLHDVLDLLTVWIVLAGAVLWSMHRILRALAQRRAIERIYRERIARIERGL